MKLYYIFYIKLNAIIIKVRALKNFYFFKNVSTIIGKNLTIRTGAGKHIFGNKNIILDNVIFEVYNPKASIQTGNYCMFAFGVVISCCKNITIGDHVWIGEYTSIRDSTHIFSINSPLGSLPDKIEPIKIGNNVWIGRGCLIMQGVTIEDNVVIAANSVVKGNILTGNIYGGVPAKFLKKL